jgi:serine protease inhibitor
MHRVSSPFSHRPAVRVRWSLLAVIGLVLGAPGCDWITGGGEASPPAEITELPRALTQAEEAVLRGSTEFGLALLRQVVAEDPAETHVISPFSASVALGMALEGADGVTFEEMRATLGFADRGAETLDRQAIGESYRDLLALLAEVDPAVSFQVANAVWHDLPWTPRPAFVQAMDANFSAPVTGLDFGDPGTPDAIDRWVSDATRGRIDGISPRPIPSDAVAYLVNALHFLGDWREAFDPDDTRDHLFREADGSTTPIRLMSRHGKVRAGGWRGHTVVDLPYGGAAWSMTLVLPSAGVGLAGLVESLDAQGWGELVSNFSEVQAQVAIPRFTLSWEGSLKNPLAAMGMQSLFNPHTADLSRLFEGDARLVVTDVRQKTFLRVDERGTEAAAVTSVDVGVTSAPPSFVFDRPFLLAIRERLSGTLLFVGAMATAPTEG